MDTGSDDMAAIDAQDAAPRRSARRRWLGWCLAALVVVCAAASMSLSWLTGTVLVVALASLLSLAAYWSLPAPNEPVRRRLWWLLLMPVPWILGVLLGPLGPVGGRPEPARVSGMQLIQNLSLGASVLLSVALIGALPRARRLTAALAGLNLLLTVIVVSVSSLILDPGS